MLNSVLNLLNQQFSMNLLAEGQVDVDRITSIPKPGIIACARDLSVMVTAESCTF